MGAPLWIEVAAVGDTTPAKGVVPEVEMIECDGFWAEIDVAIGKIELLKLSTKPGWCSKSACKSITYCLNSFGAKL